MHEAEILEKRSPPTGTLPERFTELRVEINKKQLRNSNQKL